MSVGWRGNNFISIHRTRRVHGMAARVTTQLFDVASLLLDLSNDSPTAA
jgi:hypothetical protein